MNAFGEINFIKKIYNFFLFYVLITFNHLII